MASADVDLLQMADPAVSGGDGDVLELDIHVVFGYLVEGESSGQSAGSWNASSNGLLGFFLTFQQLSSVCLA